ncbi:alpha/beta fold hydrolase [Parasphingorhabdus pacifica]
MTAPPQGVEVDEVEYPAGKIRFYHAGESGPPIVLLHGACLDNGLLSWRHAIPALATNHRVFAPDLPGQGGSRPWRGRGNQRTLEEVIRWSLDSWQLPQACVVGLSMGASVATGFALRHPQRVSGLVLVSPGGMQHRVANHLAKYLAVRIRGSGRTAARILASNRRLVRRMLLRNVFTGGQPIHDLESIVDEVVAEAHISRTVFTDWQRDAIGRSSMRTNHLPNLAGINCPSTVIHGEQDRIVPLPVAHDVTGAIQGTSLRVIPNAGHWPNREKPDEFNALLREFVDQL